jgi:hypothetical protein
MRRTVSRQTFLKAIGMAVVAASLDSCDLLSTDPSNTRDPSSGRGRRHP